MNIITNIYGLRSFAPPSPPRHLPLGHLPLLIWNNNTYSIFYYRTEQIIEQTIFYLSMVLWLMPFRVVCGDFSPVTYWLHMVTNRVLYLFSVAMYWCTHFTVTSCTFHREGLYIGGIQCMRMDPTVPSLVGWGAAGCNRMILLHRSGQSNQ